MPERDPLNWPGIPDGTPMGWTTDAGQRGESPFSVPSDVKFRLLRRFAWQWPSELAQKVAARKRRAMGMSDALYMSEQAAQRERDAKLNLIMFSTPPPGLPTGPPKDLKAEALRLRGLDLHDQARKIEDAVRSSIDSSVHVAVEAANRSTVNCSAPTNVEDTPRGEAEAKKKRRASGEAKKKEETHEAAVSDAQVAALSLKHDHDLDDVERGAFYEDGRIDFGPVDAKNIKPNDIAAAQKLAAERREAYVTGFKIDSRSLAVWAIRKFLEAKNWLETIKGVMKAEVDRAKTSFEGREAFFLEKLKDWADTQKRDTAASIRMPEGAARLEYYKRTVGGVEITDADELRDALVKKYGLWECLERGLVAQRTELVSDAARAHLSVEANRKDVDGGYAWADPVEIDAVKVVRVGGKE